jgi:hypothetical protein
MRIMVKQYRDNKARYPTERAAEQAANERMLLHTGTTIIRLSMYRWWVVFNSS